MRRNILVLCLAGIMLTGCGTKVAESAIKAGSATSGKTPDSVEVVQVTSSSEHTSEESVLRDVLSGITDRQVKKDAKDLGFLSGILYDPDIVKDVTVDDHAIDLGKEGSYTILYHVVLDPEKLEQYEKSAFTVKAQPFIDVKRTVRVLSKEDAQKAADAGEIVLDTGMQPVKRSDGSVVDLPKTEVPKSCKDKGTDPVDAASKRPVVETPKKQEQPEQKKEEKAETKAQKKESAKASSSSSTRSEKETPAREMSASSTTKTRKGHYETRTVTDRAAWTETVVDKEGYNERVSAGSKTVVDQPEWDEYTPYYVYVCGCGAEFTSGAALTAHMEQYEANPPHDTEGVLTRYNTVHHSAVTHEEQIFKDVWHPAETHTIQHPAQTHQEKIWVED